jgi:hypothetical protein
MTIPPVNQMTQRYDGEITLSWSLRAGCAESVLLFGDGMSGALRSDMRHAVATSVRTIPLVIAAIASLLACSSGPGPSPQPQPTNVELAPDIACQMLHAAAVSRSPSGFCGDGCVDGAIPECASACPAAEVCVVEKSYFDDYVAVESADGGHAGAAGPQCPQRTGTVTVTCYFGAPD